MISLRALAIFVSSLTLVSACHKEPAPKDTDGTHLPVSDLSPETQAKSTPSQPTAVLEQREASPTAEDGTGPSFQFHAPTLNATAISSARTLIREVDNLSRVMSVEETDAALRAIREARDIAAGRAPASALLCVPSSSRPGKYCMKSINGDSTCVGNYFDTSAMCKTSLLGSRSGRACYQSESKPGKALISLMQTTSGVIGNYYSDFDSCTNSMAHAYGPLICMESAKYSGKWFLANLNNNAEQVGGYVDSFAACIETF